MNRHDLAFGHFLSEEQWESSFGHGSYQAKTSLKRPHTEVREQPRQRALQGSSSRAVVPSSSKQKNQEKLMKKVELWKCTKCEKRYEHKSSLKVHIMKVHEQPKQRPLPASKQGSSLKQRSEKQGQKPSKVTNVAMRKTSKQVQNNTKNVTVNVVNKYYPF